MSKLIFIIHDNIFYFSHIIKIICKILTHSNKADILVIIARFHIRSIPMNLIFFIICSLCILQIWASEIEIDYTKANKNKEYERVPQNILVWAKYQAVEPVFMHSGPLRGHGFFEPYQNNLINSIRNSGIETYVNYFTVAKTYYYAQSNKYFICRDMNRPFSVYKKYIEDTVKNNFKLMNKYQLFSIPINLRPPLSLLAVNAAKQKLFEKHMYPSSQIINIKSLINDPNLKTIQIEGMASGIMPYIYNHPEKDRTIKAKYKSHVYEFVASDTIQMVEMLNGFRMDYFDAQFSEDFHWNMLKKKKIEIKFLQYSHKEPSSITFDDYYVNVNRCEGEDLGKLKKVIQIINDRIVKMRGNYSFWSKVLKQFSIDTKTNYQPPEIFFFTKETFINKRKIQEGFFDISKKIYDLKLSSVN